jgi:hypothetical protein
MPEAATALTFPDVAAAICRGPDRVERVFASRGERERRAVAPALIKAYRHTTRDFGARLEPDGSIVQRKVRSLFWPQLPPMQLALLGCATGSELRKLGRLALPSDFDAAYRILSDRRPEWLPGWVDYILERPEWRADQIWQLARRFVREGVIARPDWDAYIDVMIAGLAGFRERRVRAELERDSELLEHELWRIFEVEGGELGGLVTADAAYNEKGGWSQALRELAVEGKLDRARLLDASLDALSRDFGAHRTSWYTRFHEQLEPTEAERAERFETYLGLLASPVAPTVGFAMRALGKIPARAVAAGPLIDALPAALSSDRKGVVKDALRLLDRVVKDAPQHAGACARAAAGALQHEAPDVQERALALIARWTAGAPDEDVRVELLAYAEVVAATARPAFDALVAGGTDAGGSSPDAVGSSLDARRHAEALADLEARASKLPPDVAAALAVPTALAAARAGRLAEALPPLPAPGEPVLDGADRLEPIADLDALGDLLARLIESPDAPPEDFELALDGIARMCATREPFKRELAPLVSRIEQTSAGWLPLARAVLAWARGSVKRPMRTWGNPVGVGEFLHARATEVAARAAALRPAPLLAAPSHRRGWIEPATLVARVAALEGDPPRFDLVQALHRLAPDGRPAALAAAEGLPGDAAAALRYALGGPRRGGDPFALIAAWAVRGEPGEEPPMPRLALRRPRPVAPARHRHELGTVTEKPQWWRPGEPESVTRLCVNFDPPRPEPVLPQPTAWIPALQSSTVHRWLRVLDAPAVRHLRLVWPGGGEEFLACAAQHLADWAEGGSSTEASAYLEPLLEPYAAASPLAVAALVLGLGSANALSAGAATDALAAAVEDGRVTAAGLRPPLRMLLGGRHIKAGRLGPRMAAVAVHSPLHAEVVREALEAALSGDAAGAPRDLHALLEPLNELCAQAGAAIAEPEARALLAGVSGRSKTARLAQALLARAGESRLAPKASLLAAEARVARAERWASVTPA